MKKSFNYLCRLLGCSLALSGCISEQEFEPVVEGSGIPINLESGIVQAATKVNAQGFETGDALGLYAVNYSESNQTPGVLQVEGNQADHVKYVFDYEDWKWTPVAPVYYKDVNTNVDLYVFYPHAEPQSVEAYTFEVQKDQSSAETDGKLAGYEASDFLWAKVENVAPTEAKIKVQMNHMMAGALVVLAEGEGFDAAGDWNLLDKKVLVTNTTRKATIDLSTGTVSPLGGPQTTGIVMCPQTDGSFRAIVVPQTVDAGTALFSITVGGQSYSFSKSENFTYVPGKLNKFTITVNRKYPSGEYEFVLSDTQITDWKEDINTHEGEARQYYCVNVTEPGTLGRLIKADKKNPDKIRNLKVSGKIWKSDMDFMRDSMSNLQSINLREVRICASYTYSVNEDNGRNDYTFNEPKSEDELKELIPKMENIASYWESPADQLGVFGSKQLINFVFPEILTSIPDNAFSNSSLLAGALIIPDGVKTIGENAFSECSSISSLYLPEGLETIEYGAFYRCRGLSGTLHLPESLNSIGDLAFSLCSGLGGNLVLPHDLIYLGTEAFADTGFSGDLTIPESLTELQEGVFRDCSGLNGQLYLHDNVKFTSVNNAWGTFQNCSFTGELIIPENSIEIPDKCFSKCNFTSIRFHEHLAKIGNYAFDSNVLSGVLTLPESLVSLGQHAFSNCSMLEGIVIPQNLAVLQSGAFKKCYGLNKITSKPNVPPVVQSGVFDGVPKDNFTVEVPASAVKRYQADPQWGEFKRIAAHYDFSISSNLSRTLNAGKSQTYILRAPANHSWSIESKPEWITVSPESGTGKAEVTVTFAQMSDSEVETFNEEGFFNQYGSWVEGAEHAGRAGEIVFKLDDVAEYTTSMRVEQYDYDHADGDILTLQEATVGNGVDIVLMGDCYDARDIASGAYLNDIQEAYGHYFAVEPYTTYKDYFNVYAVFGESSDSGMGTLNTIRNAKFGSTFGENRIVQPDVNLAFEYACKAPINNNLSQTLVIMIENTSTYDGVCYMYGDGSALAVCPKSADAYPYDFRGIVQHEAGGHGFGKLGDEYVYHNAFISTCTCTDCGHVNDFTIYKSRDWYRNLELSGDVNEVAWSHLIFNPKYSNVVDVYEGGYYHSRGVYRSEPTSCMNNNIPYFSAVSRQAIVERIMEYAGEEFTLEKFYANDSDAFGATTKSISDIHQIYPLFNNGRQHAPVYMGESPEFLKK